MRGNEGKQMNVGKRDGSPFPATFTVGTPLRDERLKTLWYKLLASTVRKRTEAFNEPQCRGMLSSVCLVVSIYATMSMKWQ